MGSASSERHGGEQLRDGHVYTHTYSVADLVIPIPNFPPNGRIGLAGALSDAYTVSGNGVGGMWHVIKMSETNVVGS